MNSNRDTWWRTHLCGTLGGRPFRPAADDVDGKREVTLSIRTQHRFGVGEPVKLIAAAIAICLAAACSDVKKRAPRILIADGDSYVACRGDVLIKNDNPLLGNAASFQVQFTDAQGFDHVLKGVQKISLIEIGEFEPLPMPDPLPDVHAKTSSGNPVVEGNPYTWPDGTRAILRGGKWRPVMRKNALCSS